MGGGGMVRQLTTRHKLQGRGALGKPSRHGVVVSVLHQPTAAPCQLDAVVRQRIRHPAGLPGWLEPWAGAPAAAWRSRGAGRPRPLSGPWHATGPSGRQGASSARPALRPRPPRASVRVDARSWGPGAPDAPTEAFCEPGRAAPGGCAGLAAPLTGRAGRKDGARPGPGPARPGQKLKGMTGLRTLHRASPNCRSPRSCCRVSAG